MTIFLPDTLTRRARLISYHFRRLNWVTVGHFYDQNKYPIVDPIFFLGNQGGGLSLITRMLRRNRSIVSCTGNANYWSGGDELQRVYALTLPPALRLGGSLLGGDPPHAHLTPPRSWSYGTDDLVNAYHTTEVDARPQDAATLHRIIGRCLARFALCENPRFIDKSQVYTLKTRHIQALFPETTPHFILVTRDPLAAIVRAAGGRAGDIARYHHLTHQEKIALCAQHWDNCMRIALDDSRHLKKFTVLKFEDIVRAPEHSVRAMCDFIGIAFDPDMLPAPHHTIPFATRVAERWYPINPKAAERPARIDESDRRAIVQRCGKTAERLGYVL